MLLDPEWVKNIMSLNRSKIEKASPGAKALLSHPIQPGYGLEGSIHDYVKWLRIPIGTMDFYPDGDNGFYWGILRPGVVRHYCGGQYDRGSFWAESECLLRSCTTNKGHHSRGSSYIAKSGYNRVANQLTEICREQLKASQRLFGGLVVGDPHHEILIYVVYYSDDGSEDIAREYYKLFPNHTMPILAEKGTLFGDSVVYRDVLSARRDEWQNKTYVGIVNAKTIGLSVTEKNIYNVLYNLGFRKSKAESAARRHEYDLAPLVFLSVWSAWPETFGLMDQVRSHIHST